MNANVVLAPLPSWNDPRLRCHWTSIETCSPRQSCVRVSMNRRRRRRLLGSFDSFGHDGLHDFLGKKKLGEQMNVSEEEEGKRAQTLSNEPIDIVRRKC